MANELVRSRVGDIPRMLDSQIKSLAALLGRPELQLTFQFVGNSCFYEWLRVKPLKRRTTNQTRCA